MRPANAALRENYGLDRKNALAKGTAIKVEASSLTEIVHGCHVYIVSVQGNVDLIFLDDDQHAGEARTDLNTARGTRRQSSNMVVTPTVNAAAYTALKGKKSGETVIILPGLRGRIHTINRTRFTK